MKSLLPAICFLSVLQSCVQEVQDQLVRSASPEVYFITPWQPGGGMGLYIRTSGEPHPVQEGIQSYTTIGRGQFAQVNIPSEAIAAVSFLVAGDSRADRQAAYVVEKDKQLWLYKGYFVPGYGGPIEWKREKLR